MHVNARSEQGIWFLILDDSSEVEFLDSSLFKKVLQEFVLVFFCRSVLYMDTHAAENKNHL